MKPKIGMADKDMNKAVDMLSIILADEHTLYIKTRKFHWNVAGESFMELHKLFQEQYTELEEVIDEVAERINKLGGKTIGTMKEFCEITRLKEDAKKYPEQKEMLQELLEDNETIIIALRKDVEEAAEKIKDAGTADFLTGLMEQHETIAWKLRRYLS
jgi:starvation-inducible DNA-binding protein